MKQNLNNFQKSGVVDVKMIFCVGTNCYIKNSSSLLSETLLKTWTIVFEDYKNIQLYVNEKMGF